MEDKRRDWQGKELSVKHKYSSLQTAIFLKFQSKEGLIFHMNHLLIDESCHERLEKVNKWMKSTYKCINHSKTLFASDDNCVRMLLANDSQE